MEHRTKYSPPEETGLVDIQSVSIDPTLPREERITKYLSQIKDPYHFMCAGIEVHTCYSEDGPTLMECLKQLID